MTTSFQPWYTGCVYPSWDIPLNTDSGPDDITNAPINTFTLTFHASNGTDTLGTGTFSVKTLNPAEVYYQPSAADVAAPFTGYLYIKCQFNGLTTVYDPIGGATTGSYFVITAS